MDLTRDAHRNPALFAWSDFLFKVKKQPEAAAAEAYRAVAANPNDLDNQITLIIMLINMGKTIEAQEQINQTRQLDRTGVHIHALDELAKLQPISVANFFIFSISRGLNKFPYKKPDN